MKMRWSVGGGLLFGVSLALAQNAPKPQPAQPPQSSQFNYVLPAYPRSIPTGSRGPMVGVPQPVNGLPNSPLFPSSPILPMTNAIAPMMNPVLPIVPSPFIRYGEIPTVVIPGPSESRPGESSGRGDRPGLRYGDRRSEHRALQQEPSGTPTGTFRTPGTPQPPSLSTPSATPASTPAESRNARRSVAQEATSTGGSADSIMTVPIASDGALSATSVSTKVDETVPSPDVRRREQPTVGISRAQVMEKLGNPWGRFLKGGTESLYFDGGLVVVLVDGRVVQVRP